MKTTIEMAREAGLRSAVLLHLYGKEAALCDSELEELEQIKCFASLVRADERDICLDIIKGLFYDPNDSMLEFIVDAIRARGNT